MASTCRWISSALALSVSALSAHTLFAADTKGPSSSQKPYIVSLKPDISTTSLLTVGDSVNVKPGTQTPYRMVGIPDGLGAYDNGDGTFTVLMNHELGATAGVVRDHGAKGAFISRYTIRKSDLAVLRGEDLIQNVATFDAATGLYNPLSKGVAFGRFCSADLAPQSAFMAGGVGYRDRLFLNGEETGAEGRAFAHNLDGFSYELPRLGKFSWENALANPGTGAKTVVVGTDDSTPGQVYVYIGDKTNFGSPVDRAGLTNGLLYGIKVQDVLVEPRETGIPSGTPFTLAPLGNVENKTGAQIQADSIAAGVTEFLRPEDGSWDPRNPSVFYFNTTDRFDTVKAGTGAQVGRSRLWRLKFSDINNMAAGGTIEMVLNGTEPHQMLDNMTVSYTGEVLLQEDPGNQPYLAKVRRFNIASNTFEPIAEHSPEFFAPGAPALLTTDEESSGIIDVSNILGRGSYLLDVQAHYSVGDPELVEGGQLLLLRAPAPNEAPVSTADAYEATEDTTLLVAAPGVLANDTDIDANTLTATLVAGPANGTLVLNANGSFVYTPKANFNGTDTFTYKAADASLSGNTVTVTILVKPQSDSPTNVVPGAQTTAEDTALMFNTANGNVISVADSDSGDDLVQVELSATNGKLFLSSTTGLTIAEGNAEGSGERLRFSGKQSAVNAALLGLSFVPNSNFNGAARITIITSESRLSAPNDTDSIDISVTPVNDAPVAVEDITTANNGGVRVIPVLANDFDVEGDALSITSISKPARGTAVLAGNSIRYTASSNFGGVETFTYTISDGKGGTATGTVKVAVRDIIRPTISIETPRTGSQINGLQLISGKTADQGYGVKRVLVTITSLTRNQSWTGSGFGRRGTQLDAAFNAAQGTWSYAKGPNASQLGFGTFVIDAISIDAVGNRSLVARSIVRRNAPPSVPAT